MIDMTKLVRNMTDLRILTASLAIEVIGDLAICLSLKIKAGIT
jgi:hypothetical protein